MQSIHQDAENRCLGKTEERQSIEEIICVVREGNVFLALRGAQGVTQCLSVCPPVKFWFYHSTITSIVSDMTTNEPASLQAMTKPLECINLHKISISSSV